jgi:hypothetical protein
MHFEMKRLGRQANNLVRDIKGVCSAKKFNHDGFCRTIEQEVLDLIDEPEAR